MANGKFQFVFSFLMIMTLVGCSVGNVASPEEYPVELSEADKKHPLVNYYHNVKKPNAAQYGQLVYHEPENGLPFEEMNKMLEKGYLPIENGYTQFEDGSGYVAVNIQFPEASGEMLDWWFHWVGYDTMRYKIWYPGLHALALYEPRVIPDTFSISHAVSLHTEGITKHTVETLRKGGDLQDLMITFVSPEQFDLEDSLLGEDQWAVCANVQSGGRTVLQMVHFIRKTEEGVEMRSRFWVGREFPWIARKIALDPEELYDLAHHCLTEYTQLASFLPEVYENYH